MSGKYIRTAAENDTLSLVLKKCDEVVAAYASLKIAHGTLLTAHNALAAKLNLDAGVTDTNYVANIADVSTAAPATCVSEFE
jgi:hypothetical protein